LSSSEDAVEHFPRYEGEEVAEEEDSLTTEPFDVIRAVDKKSVR
jgi:hypothetical protein